jgi:hypothetical protein
MSKGKKGNRNKNLRKDGTPKGTPHKSKYAGNIQAEKEAKKSQSGRILDNDLQDTLAIVQEAALRNSARNNYQRREGRYQPSSLYNSTTSDIPDEEWQALLRQNILRTQPTYP